MSILLAAGSTAGAAELEASPAPPLVSDPFFNEVRLGALGHGIDGSPEMGDVDLNLEVLFAKPFHASGWVEWLIPRPHIGADVNFEGKTSTIYAGVTWHVDLFDTPWFAETSFGGSFNNGELHEIPGDDMNALGCHALFRESASLGYQLDLHWNVTATIEHNSNAGLCDENRGLTNAGVRVGYKF